MKRIYKAIKRYVLIYLLFMKNSLIGYMEYRANLFAALTMELTYLLSKVIYVIFIYNSGITLNGASPDEVMLFIGTYIIMTGIYVGFFMENFYALPGHVRDGTLDMYVTKPLSLQFMVTMRHVNFFLPIPNLITGTIMVVIAWSRLQIYVTLGNILGYILIIIGSTFVAYAVFFAPQILSFWTVKTSAITEIADRCWDFNVMPMIIYSRWIQRIGVFIIPVFFITNFPAMFVVGKLNGFYMLWAFIAPVIFMTLVTLFWKYAVRNYSSASS